MSSCATGWPLTTRVSVASEGTQANARSEQPSISADGRYVAFWSQATNLVPEDTNDVIGDVFVHDLISGATEMVSVASDEVQGNNASASPAISADGRYVAFASWSDHLTAGDTNGMMPDVFVRDRSTGETTLVSVGSDGAQVDANSMDPSISADGRYVAFICNIHPDPLPGPAIEISDVFVRDRVAGTTSMVSGPRSDTFMPVSEAIYFPPCISAGGRYVSFMYIPTPAHEPFYLEVYDRQTGTSEAPSVDMNDWLCPLSADGRYIAFSASTISTWRTPTIPTAWVTSTWAIVCRCR